MKRLILLVTLAGGAGAMPAAAHQHNIDAALMKLEPTTRMEQRCIGRAIGSVRREHKDFRPDEAVVYAFSDPAISGTQVHAPGAAIRGHGQWYHIAFDCQTTPDGLGVQSFSYELGSPVPRSEWQAHLLVPQ